MPPRKGKKSMSKPSDQIIEEMEELSEAEMDEILDQKDQAAVYESQAEAEAEAARERDNPDDMGVVVGILKYELSDIPGLLERVEAAEHQVSLWKKRTENARRQADLWRKVANAIKGEKGVEIDRDLQI